MGKRGKLDVVMVHGEKIMIVLNDHVFLCKKVIRQRRALVYCNKMHYSYLERTTQALGRLCR